MKTQNLKAFKSIQIIGMNSSKNGKKAQRQPSKRMLFGRIDRVQEKKKLEYDVFPQPYLGNYENHSVITLNLNPSRSRKNEENIEFEKNNLPKFKKAENYHEYAKGFPTYDTHPFWKKQDGWIDRMFENLGKNAPSEKEIKHDGVDYLTGNLVFEEGDKSILPK